MHALCERKLNILKNIYNHFKKGDYEKIDLSKFEYFKDDEQIYLHKKEI